MIANKYLAQVLLEAGPSNTLAVVFQNGQFQDFLQVVRSLPGRQYDRRTRKWYIPGTEQAVIAFCELFREYLVYFDMALLERFPHLSTLLHGNENATLSRMQSMMKLKGFSRATKKAYWGHVMRFRRYGAEPLHEMEPDVIQAYLETLIDQGKSSSYIHQAVSALLIIATS